MGSQAHRPQRDALITTGATGSWRERPDRAARLQVDEGAGRLDALTTRAQGGDRPAFEALVRATTADTYALAVRLTGNEHDARDVVQEAYLRAFRSIGSFRGDAAFTTWLFRITANCSATYVRRHGAGRPEQVHPDPAVIARPVGGDPDPMATATVERDRLVRALDALAPTLRAVVVLRDVYDLSTDAIAAELGISGAATRVRLHRGRMQLRRALFPDPGRHRGIVGSRDAAVSRPPPDPPGRTALGTRPGRGQAKVPSRAL